MNAGLTELARIDACAKSFAAVLVSATTAAHQAITEAAINMMGDEAMVGFGDETRGGLGAPVIGTENTPANWIASFMIARPGTIYAGTSEVQRNIVGERVLGLPKEPRADKGAWNESR